MFQSQARGSSAQGWPLWAQQCLHHSELCGIASPGWAHGLWLSARVQRKRRDEAETTNSAPSPSSEPSWRTLLLQKRGKKKRRRHRERFEEKSTASTDAACRECLLFQHKGRTPGGSAQPRAPSSRAHRAALFGSRSSAPSPGGRRLPAGV